MPVPILLISDDPSTHSGLGRITRDIATVISKLPEFRVATMGRAGAGSSRLPWPQFHLDVADVWGQERFESIWNDFSGGSLGIVMTVWDASRVRYLVDEQWPGFPITISNRFQRWGYFPVDSTGPNDRLNKALSFTISKYNRVLAYGLWAKDVIERSIGREVDWMPHGIDFSTFQIRDRVGARLATGFGPEHRVIGMVATNQLRKDWGTAFAAFNEVRKARPECRFWVHIDDPVRHWNIEALVLDYGLKDYIRVTLSESMTDEQLSWMYSGCDLTILPSSEGFGYPIVESLACGTPVIHSSYAGGAELVANTELLIVPVAYRLEGVFNCLRPVWKPEDWVNAIFDTLDRYWDPQELRRQVSYLDWQNLAHPWKKWLLKGLSE